MKHFHSRIAFIFFIAFLAVVSTTTPSHAQAAENGAIPVDFPDLYFVDAHSQMARGLDPNDIIPLMNKAGVRRTILSARNDRKPRDIANLVARYPDRLTGAVRSKGGAFNENRPKFKRLLKKQLRNPAFNAMAEVILYHAQKGNKAPEINVSINSPQVRLLIEAALERGWPFIAHYEFAAAGWSKDEFMEEFEAMAAKYPELPFVLIHMGQLYADEVKKLIEAHPNVFFLTSHSNPINNALSNQPWTNMFKGDEIDDDWKALMIDYPKRFILAFDNVWAEHWGGFYLKQAKLWRKALGNLPPEVATAVAHGNAERLWNLPKP